MSRRQLRALRDLFRLPVPVGGWLHCPICDGAEWQDSQCYCHGTQRITLAQGAALNRAGVEDGHPPLRLRRWRHTAKPRRPKVRLKLRENRACPEWVRL